jgi:hypothetical protein
MMIFERFNSEKTDRTIKSVIGMSRAKFDALVPVFAEADEQMQAERLERKEIRRIRIGGPKGLLDTPQKRLFFILYYLKTYPTFDVLGFHFSLSAGHAHDYATLYMKVLQRTLENLDLAPERTTDSLDRFRQAIEKYDEIIIDGMEVPCVRPVDEATQKDRYSGKKSAIP